MKTQEIGQSGMIASRVALGVMRMDALDAADAARTVAVAHDSGIDYFDTADIYGFHDHAAHASSKRFGQAWKDGSSVTVIIWQIILLSSLRLLAIHSTIPVPSR